MSILSFAGENKDFLKGIINRKVKTYDASKNRINVAGMYLDGVTSATLSSQSRTNTDVGVDEQYQATYDTFTTQTLSVSLLPETYCYKKLQELDFKCQLHQAQFTISVEENGQIISVFIASVANFGEINISNEASDKVVVFNVKTKKTTNSNIKVEASEVVEPSASSQPYVGNAKTYPYDFGEEIQRTSL